MSAVKQWALPLALCVSGCGSGSESTASPLDASPRVTHSGPSHNGQSSSSEAAKTTIEKLSSKHLPNPVRIHSQVISGGLPEGDAAFEELKSLGIKTVISVDGAKPDVARAEKYGLRYVHLPHGYDGVPDQRTQELAKAVRDLPGPFYIHCHHGKHRSPAAAAVACVGAGLIDHDSASKVLQVAGTSDAYRGLFQSVERAQRIESTVLDSVTADFPTIAKLPAMAEAMVEIEHIHDRLKSAQQAGWKSPADQPALVPAHEALLLREQFTELLRTKELADRPEKFKQLTREAEVAAQALEDALQSGLDSEAITKLLQSVSDNCKGCHKAFRDVPMTDKSI
jgi:protein tyrosine phosphatase (PTP) superfamily phosphohydrolase (DUF442 family)